MKEKDTYEGATQPAGSGPLSSKDRLSGTSTHETESRGAVTKAESDTNSEVTDSMDATLSPDPLVGIQLKDRYFIEKELGRGGIGVVYFALDRQLFSRPVVVKILHDHQDPDPNSWVQKKFRQEIEALTRIEHPSVVALLDAGVLPDGKSFFVMQYVEGVTLRQVLEKEKVLSFEQVAKIVSEVGEALTAASAKGIYHRDLKPENIMLQTVGEGKMHVKIIDFGIAKVINSEVSNETNLATISGTPAYMAPEQILCKPASAATDIYALGVIAYEMLTGKRPYPIVRGEQLFYELHKAQRLGVRVKPHDLRLDLPAGASSVILKALEFEPEDRHIRASDFADALTKALSQGNKAFFMKVFGSSPNYPSFPELEDPSLVPVDPQPSAKPSPPITRSPGESSSPTVRRVNPKLQGMEKSVSRQDDSPLTLDQNPTLSRADEEAFLNIFQKTDIQIPLELVLEAGLLGKGGSGDEAGTQTLGEPIQKTQEYNRMVSTSEIEIPPEPVAEPVAEPVSKVPQPKKKTTIPILVGVGTVAVVLIVGGYFLSGSFEKPAGPVAAPTQPAVTKRAVNYAVLLEPSGKNRSEPPVQLAGQEIVFRQGDQFRFQFSSPQPGYLYLLNEAPQPSNAALPKFTALFPSPEENNQLSENQQVVIPKPTEDGIVFFGTTGTEKIWIVWASDPVPELEATKKLMNAKDKGVIRDSAEIAAVRDLLVKYPTAQVKRDDERKELQATAVGNIVVALLKLEHR